VRCDRYLLFTFMSQERIFLSTRSKQPRCLVWRRCLWPTILGPPQPRRRPAAAVPTVTRRHVQAILQPTLDAKFDLRTVTNHELVVHQFRTNHFYEKLSHFNIGDMWSLFFAKWYSRANMDNPRCWGMQIPIQWAGGGGETVVSRASLSNSSTPELNRMENAQCAWIGLLLVRE
jgi:hypothetical protein